MDYEKNSDQEAVPVNHSLKQGLILLIEFVLCTMRCDLIFVSSLSVQRHTEENKVSKPGGIDWRLSRRLHI